MPITRRQLLTGTIVTGLIPELPSLAAERFTIAIVPDSQFEVVDAGDTRLRDRFRWLAEKSRALNLKMVIHTGDIVNTDTDDHIQYERASAAVAVLDDNRLPYTLCIGNHDTPRPQSGESNDIDALNSLRDTRTFNRYFPATRQHRFEGVCERGKVDNGYMRFTAGGLKWLVINLEIWARSGALSWARKVIEKYPDHNVILATHSFLDRDGRIDERPNAHGDNTPRQIFEKLVKPYSNVRLVVCGHTGSHAYREDLGTAGNKICEFLTAYHSRSDNPVRLLELDTRRGTIRSRVFCPLTGIDRRDGSAFTVTNVNWIDPHSTHRLSIMDLRDAAAM